MSAHGATQIKILYYTVISGKTQLEDTNKICVSPCILDLAIPGVGGGNIIHPHWRSG
jgi:hypothetical protein